MAGHDDAEDISADDLSDPKILGGLLADTWAMSDGEDEPDLKDSDVKKVNVHLGGCPRWLAVARLRNFRRKAVRNVAGGEALGRLEADQIAVGVLEKNERASKITSPIASITLDAGVAALIHVLVPRDESGVDTLDAVEAAAREVAWSARGVDDSSFSRLVQRSLLREVACLLGMEVRWDVHFAGAQADLDKALRRPAGERRKQADLARGSAAELEGRQILRSLRPSSPAAEDKDQGLCPNERGRLLFPPREGEVRLVMDVDEQTQKRLLFASPTYDIEEYLKSDAAFKAMEMRSLLKLAPSFLEGLEDAQAEKFGPEEVGKREAFKERVEAAFASAKKSADPQTKDVPPHFRKRVV